MSVALFTECFLCSIRAVFATTLVRTRASIGVEDRRFLGMTDFSFSKRLVSVLRGLLIFLFGVIAWASQPRSVEDFSSLFGVFAFVDGTSLIFFGKTGRVPGQTLIGVVGVLVAVYILLDPPVSIAALVYVITGWVVLDGVSQILLLTKVKGYEENRIRLVLAGITALSLGVIIAVCRYPDALVIVVLVAVYAMILGLTNVLIALATR
jgi:uncharacterized membrane protein HdeD (DUF308 family)